MEPTPWILNDAGEALWGPHGRGMSSMPPVEPTLQEIMAAQAPKAAADNDYTNG